MKGSALIIFVLMGVFLLIGIFVLIGKMNRQSEETKALLYQDRSSGVVDCQGNWLCSLQVISGSVGGALGGMFGDKGLVGTVSDAIGKIGKKNDNSDINNNN